MFYSLEYRERFRKNILEFFGKEEVWVLHPVYFDILVSSYGRIKKISSNYIYKPHKNSQNYSGLTIQPSNGKRIYKHVHRLVGETFFNYVDYRFYEVNHINGDKDDNSIFNLNWLTREENIKHAKDTNLLRPCYGEKNGRYKHTKEDIFKIKDLIKKGNSVKDIAKEVKLSISSVYHLINRRVFSE